MKHRTTAMVYVRDGKRLVTSYLGEGSSPGNLALMARTRHPNMTVTYGPFSQE